MEEIKTNDSLEPIINLAGTVGLNAALLYYRIKEQLSKCEKSNNGYIALDAKKLKELTALTRVQQEIAIEKLINNGLLHVEKKGVPPTKNFKPLK